MTIRHLKVFISVCALGGLTAASKALFISQPSVRAAIADMENEYGVKLFERISRRLYLTETGKQLLEQARYLVHLFDAMESDLRGSGQRGVLRIGSSITIGNRFLPALVLRFNEKHESMQVKAVVNSTEKLEQLILENELDLALIEGIPHHPKIVSSVFMQDELVVICSNDDPLASYKTISLEQLAASNLILRETGRGTRELFDITMALHNKNVEPVWESVSTQAIVRAVKAGLGISVLPYWLVQEEISARAVSLLKLEDVTFLRNYYLIRHADKFLTGPMRDFIEICQDISVP